MRHNKQRTRQHSCTSALNFFLCSTFNFVTVNTLFQDTPLQGKHGESFTKQVRVITALLLAVEPISPIAAEIKSL